MSTASARADCRRDSSSCPVHCGWWCQERRRRQLERRQEPDGLRAVHGTRVESLLGALLDVLPPADPFAPTTIVVGSHLVSRWLVREIATSRGIAAGLELLTFDRFLEQHWADDEAGRAAKI